METLKVDAELEAMRLAINTEKGTEADCPWCGNPRVSRTSYIRCNPCGTNWTHGQDYSRDHRLPALTVAFSVAACKNIKGGC